MISWIVCGRSWLVRFCFFVVLLLGSITFAQSQNTGATITYIPSTPTSGNVLGRVQLPVGYEFILEAGNPNPGEFLFTKNNQTHVFKYKAINSPKIFIITGFVDRIQRGKPTATVSYSTDKLTSGSVIARLTGFSRQGIVVTNNNGQPFRIFSQNGTFEFLFRDQAGNTGSAIATVTWIDNVKPTAQVSYSFNAKGQTVATLVNFNKPESSITVLNNNGSKTYTFLPNSPVSSFIFQLRDALGNIGTVEAVARPPEPELKADLVFDFPRPKSGLVYRDGGVTMTLSNFSKSGVDVSLDGGKNFQPGEEIAFNFRSNGVLRMILRDPDTAATGVLIARVDRIDSRPPTARFVINPSNLTTGSVTLFVTGFNRPVSNIQVFFDPLFTRPFFANNQMIITENTGFILYLRDKWTFLTGTLGVSVQNILPGSRTQQNQPVAANPDMIIQKIELAAGLTDSDGNLVAVQGSQPNIRMTIENIAGSADVVLPEGQIIGSGFIVCRDKVTNQEYYSSRPITRLLIKGGTTQIATNMFLISDIAQSPGKKTITCEVNANKAPLAPQELNTTNNKKDFTFTIIESSRSRFDISMEDSIKPIQKNLDAAVPTKGQDGIRDFILGLINKIIIPLGMVFGILIAIIGFYKLLTNDSEDEIKKGVGFLQWGVIGIIVMMSASYLGTVIFSDILEKGIMTNFSGTEVAQEFYDKALFPFLKLLIYVVLGVLFIILLTHVFRFLVDPSDEIRRHSKIIIVWNVIGMLVIISSKNIVELLYGKQEEVTRKVTNLGDIGSGFLSNRDLGFLFTIINRFMGLITLIVLAIIVVQTFQLLTKPDDESQLTKIKQSFIYVFFGILLIGAGYLITNFFIVN